MKATFTGQANNIRRPHAWDNNRGGSSDMVDIELDMSGTVDTRNIAAKPAHIRGTLQIKQLIADKLTFGNTFTITIDDGVEEPKPEVKPSIKEEAN
jgi:hypothetical protein